MEDPLQRRERGAGRGVHTRAGVRGGGREAQHTQRGLLVHVRGPVSLPVLTPKLDLGFNKTCQHLCF